ncbi:hypothetical protein ACFWTC_02980 [Streptomyces sp. NPDC058619]|uniref:hypothetical protein n=1 Tax=unclassified Streptomyces TaxID=2593676 RepID=UPI003648D11D
MSVRDDLIDEYGQADTEPLGSLTELRAKLAAYRAEVLAEAASTPLEVRRIECSIEPDWDGDETELLVCCVAEDGRPVALLLDDEARAKLAGLLGSSSAPGLDERALRLADHIVNTGGEWTTGKAHQWVAANVVPKPPVHFTRHSLQALAAHGYLRERRTPGRVSYTPNYPTEGDR